MNLPISLEMPEESFREGENTPENLKRKDSQESAKCIPS